VRIVRAALTSRSIFKREIDQGTWPTMSLAGRIAAVERLIVGLLKKRGEMVDVIMLEIGKNRPAAEDEVDRTIVFIRKVRKI